MSRCRPGLMPRGFPSLFVVLFVMQAITLLVGVRLMLLPNMTQLPDDFAIVLLVLLVFSLLMAYFVTRLLFRPVQDSLQAASSELNALRQQRSDVLFKVSNELRTRLTQMQSLLALTHEPLPADHHARLRQEVGKMEKVIHQIMQLGHSIEVDGKQMQQLQTTIEASIALCAQSQRVEFSHSLGAPRQVHINPQALQQVLCILVDNALRYSQNTVRVTAVDCLKGVRICVMDRGVGIDAALQHELLQPFTQLAGDDSDIGMGLDIVRFLSHAHGWIFLMQARNEGGSSACIILPPEP